MLNKLKINTIKNKSYSNNNDLGIVKGVKYIRNLKKVKLKCIRNLKKVNNTFRSG
jgi:hypothetical protein